MRDIHKDLTILKALVFAFKPDLSPVCDKGHLCLSLVGQDNAQLLDQFFQERVLVPDHLELFGSVDAACSLATLHPRKAVA